MCDLSGGSNSSIDLNINSLLLIATRYTLLNSVQHGVFWIIPFRSSITLNKDNKQGNVVVLDLQIDPSDPVCLLVKPKLAGFGNFVSVFIEIQCLTVSFYCLGLLDELAI